MSSFSRFTPLINSLPTTIPFIGPEAIERSRGLAVKARIGANENGFGPSPKAIAAMEQAARETWQYADPENYDLRVALAAHLGVTANHINVGGGIDGLLGLIVRMIVLPGTPVVTSLGGYPTFNFQVAGFGGRLVTVPYKDDHEDLAGLLDAVKREDAPLVYVANPDNPMGSWHSAEKIVAFAKALPETTLLILDEAYGETAPAEAIPSIESLIDLPNVIRTRTFSKAYGMAGSRVGYAISTPENANAFDKIRNHFGMNRIAIAAAMAALADTGYLEETLIRIKAARERIADIARANQLSPLPSATNFVAIDTGRDGPYSKAIVDGLMEEGVFIRLPGVAPLNRCIRVSVGPEADLALFEEALPRVLRRLE